MHDEEAASIRSFMNGAFHHVHRSVLTEKAAHKFIVVSRDVDEPSAFPRLPEKLLDDIVVGLRPVDPSAQLPDINQVPHHVEGVELVIPKEDEEVLHLAPAGAKVNVRNPARTEMSAHDRRGERGKRGKRDRR